MTSHAPSTSTRSTRPLPATAPVLRRYAVLALRLALIVALVFLGYKAARLGWIGWRAYQAARTVLALRADGDIDAADLHQIRDQLHTVEVLAADGDREVQFVMPLLDAARPLPRIGPTLAATPFFIAAGRELLAAAHAGAGLLADTAGDHGDARIVHLLVQTMRDQPAAFAVLASHVNTARAVLDVVDADALIAPLVAPVSQLQATLQLAAVALQLASDLPDLLGFDGPRTYLLLIQNNQELRATGGFISAVGAVTLENGDIAGLDLTDSYAIARNDMDHPWAPDPMRRYMGVELIFLRDANWSPDFPTSAQLARALYAQDAGVKVDGVASIDLHAVQLIVGALGPLEIPGADAPVTGDTILRQIQEFWDKPPASDITAESDYRTWVMQRKDFIPLLAESALARLRQGEYSPLALASGVDAALAQRGVQVWLAAPGPAQVLAAAGWDGALRPDPAADFLAVVDANMGYNKADAVVERSLDYTVAWPDGPTAPAQATLRITYRHSLNAPNVECTPMSGYAERYSDMVERCYFDYVRVYVPAGSELLGADGFDPGTLTAQPGEQGTHVFGGYFVLPPGQSQPVTLRYTLPPQLVLDDYRLVVQRQSGSGPLPFTLTAPDAAHTGLLVDGVLIWRPSAPPESP